MQNPAAAALRRAFIDFFVAEGHLYVPSAPLVPEHDPSLLFVNAGMVPFKHAFTGQAQAPAARAVSAQKCLRVSGKHNDLEEVGRTARHHTFFEMLGNFSFGDYFKERAIELAWRFVTKELGLDAKRLYVTVFAGDQQAPADDEAHALWRRIAKLPDARLLRFGAADNFWSMGDTGPCGPCTEIHVDLGSGPVTPADFANGRVVEIWNNVFMQYDKRADGSRSSLPKPAVDTGMGLERVAALCQGERSNYHTDLFLPLLHTIGEVAKVAYGRGDNERDVAMRVIADHARALTFLLADGVQPSADGRGYVLRRIVRRAIRHGQLLGIDRTFLPAVAGAVVDHMGAAYPELRAAAAHIQQVATAEEEAFRRTLSGGLKLLGMALDAAQAGGDQKASAAAAKGRARAQMLGGDVAFKLYDTFGFPKDLTELIAKERGIEVDEAGFQACLAEQQARSRDASKQGVSGEDELWRRIASEIGPTDFVGAAHESLPETERPGGATRWRRHGGKLWCQVEVAAIVASGEHVASLSAGQQGEVVLRPCPFYGEGGGQVGDVGALAIAPEQAPLAIVRQCRRPLTELTAAAVDSKATLEQGMVLWAGYDIATRLATRAHHSATHLLHGALRKTLGEHVTQAGSLVDSGHLRFDFSHPRALSDDERHRIEVEINRVVSADRPVVTEEMALEAARSRGALALFGEKYRAHVRVISMGDSVELCGGTHAARTGELGLVWLERDQAVKAGVRRITAVVGQAASEAANKWLLRLAALAHVLGGERLADALAKQSGLNDGKAALAALGQDREWSAVAPVLARAYSTVASYNDQAASATGEAPQDAPVQLAVNAQALGLTMAHLGPARDYAFWRPLRATWQVVRELAADRAGASVNLLAGLGTDDLGHLAAGTHNLLVAEREALRLEGAKAAEDQAGEAKRLAAAASRTASGLAYVARQLPAGGDLKAMADLLRQALGSGVVCLLASSGDRVRLLVARTPDLDGRIHAGKLVQALAPHIGGRGGGRPDLAEAGGREPAGMAALLAALRDRLAEA